MKDTRDPKDARKRTSDPHRLLPQSPDAEMGVLCSMLLGGHEMIEEMDSRLRGECFHIPHNRTIFETLILMHRARNPVDFITLTEQLRLGECLDQVGGAAFITELFTFIPTAANCEYYAEIVREKHLLRQIITVGTQYAARAYDEQDDVAQLLEEFQGELIELGQLDTEANSLRHIKEDLSLGLDRIEERYHKRGQLDGLPTGFTDIDRTLDGLKGACIYVIAGRPAMGKSAFGMAVAEHVALKHQEDLGAGKKVGRPGVAVFSIEMTREKLVDRLFASQAEITREKLRRGMLGTADFARLHSTVAAFSKAAFYLDTTAGLTITKFKAQARRAVMKYHCGLIVIDHVQHLHGVTKRSKENRSLELAEIMQGIQETSKILEVPIIVLAQIGRAAEERAQSRPTMADLKESGAIEEYADAVGLLYRPAYYAKTDDQWDKLAAKLCEGKGLDKAQTEAYVENFAELILDKNRDGGTGTFPLRFIGEFTRFEDPSGRKLYSNNAEERQKIED